MGNEGSQPANLGESLDNDINVKWSKLAGDSPFAGRDGHCACAIGNKLFVFGGVVSTDHEESTESNELLSFDTDDLKWSIVKTSGTCPAARSAATMAAVGSKLFLVGGLSRNSGWFDDVHILDSETNIWSKVDLQGQGPTPRDKLASSVLGTQIYLFGGFGPKLTEDIEEVDEFSTEEEDGDETSEAEGAEFGWFNDLFVLDTVTMSWSQPMQMNIGGPSPRAALAMATVKDQYIVIFGGRDSEARRNDVHIYDTVSRKWVVDVKISGRVPEARSFHTLTAVDNRVVVIGGRGIQDQHFNDFHIFDITSHQWLQPAVEGDVPPARGVHTATVVNNKLVIYGGSSNFNRDTMQCTELHNAVFSINTEDILSGSSRNLGCQREPRIASATETPTSSEDSSDEGPIRSKRPHLSP